MAHQIGLHMPSVPLPVQTVLPAAIQLHNPMMHGGHEPSVIGNAMFRILNDVIQPTATLSLPAAASQLDSLFPLNNARAHEEGKEDPEVFLAELWALFIDVAEQIPHDNPAQDKLAKLVKFLRAHPSLMTVKIRGITCMLWADLPSFGNSLTQEFNKFASQHTPGPGDPSANRFLNLNAFTSRLTRDRTFPCDVFALWVFRGTLEEPPSLRAKPVALLDYRVPIAAEWIQRAGVALFKSGKVFGDITALERESARRSPGAGPQWLIRDGWKLWKQQFSRISVDGRVAERTRAVAKEAALDMAMIELSVVYRMPIGTGRRIPARQGAMGVRKPTG